MQAAPEGVYVYDGRVLDHVRLFDHDGNYLRTIYPFPADKLKETKGLHWRSFPQDGARLPVREGFHQSTFLSSGRNAGFLAKRGIGVDEHNNWHGSVWGNAAALMAVRGNRIALAYLKLNRLATDGSTGGLPLTGPETAFTVGSFRRRGNWGRREVPPRSAAFSPDGKWLYMTSYVHVIGQTATKDIVLIKFYDHLPGVTRLNFETGEKTEVFLGSMKKGAGGTGNDQFVTPTSVDVDAKGRVYVSDFVNDRVQVFSPEGKYLKTINTDKPAQVSINKKTQEIYVFSWFVPNLKMGTRLPRVRMGSKYVTRSFPSKLTVYRSFDKPEATVVCSLPAGAAPYRGSGVPWRAEIDPWAKKPTLWLVTEWGRRDVLSAKRARPSSNIRLYTLEGSRLRLKRDFHRDTERSVVRTTAPEYFRQRLHVNPATGDLYVAEGQAGSGKSASSVVQIDPDTGKVRVVELPFDTEDMCFDVHGRVYLRTFYLVARYDPRTWREIPWDYGEEHKGVHTGGTGRWRKADVRSAVRLPVVDAGLHHHGGMGVSLKGNLVVAVNNHGFVRRTRKDMYGEAVTVAGKGYSPRIYPGRPTWGEVHVWNKHGQMIYEDAVPGLTKSDGVEIDARDNLYVMTTATRVLDGKLHFNDMTGTLLKVRPQKAKVLSRNKGRVKLQETQRPQRPLDVFGGPTGAAWIENALWFYGGVGFSGKNAARAGGGCDCWNARFALDYLGRSFAPEIGHHSVAVLDSGGNLITRVGKYGNADDGSPLVQGTAGPRARSIGGDEVGLFYAPYVATHTDHRLLIADPGNARLLSVKLGYHATERVHLKDVPDARE